MISSSDLLNWYTLEKRCFPWRNTDDPYDVLIAGVLLRKTTAKQVSKVFTTFIKTYPNPQSIIDADDVVIEELIRPLGLYRIRTSQMKDMCDKLVHDLGGEIPNDYDQLLQLRGVSDYIASSVLCFGFNKRVPIVDTNVIRIYRRLSGDDGLKISIIRKLAGENLPHQNYQESNWALLDLAAKICKVKNTNCTTCPISTHCEYGKNKRL